MNWLPVPFGVAAGLCWLSAFVHFLLALGNLSGRTTLGTMLFRGYEAFRPDNFTPRGRVFQRRLVHSALGFLLFVVLTAGAGAIAATAG